MKELWIDLQPDSPHALYEQIYEYIAGEMRAGRLRAGEKLPSRRALAAHDSGKTEPRPFNVVLGAFLLGKIGHRASHRTERRGRAPRAEHIGARR